MYISLSICGCICVYLKIRFIKKHYICQIRISVEDTTWEFLISRIFNSLTGKLIILIN